MSSADIAMTRGTPEVKPGGARREGTPARVRADKDFGETFSAVFESHFGRIFRYLDRSSGDPELAADLAQEAFLRLYRRGSLPDEPGAWLASVAMNLLRNTRSKEARRGRLLTEERAKSAHSDYGPPPSLGARGDGQRGRVRQTLDELAERDRDLLLLRSEGYSYRELAAALRLEEGSVGTFLARAKQRFRQAYEEAADAP